MYAVELEGDHEEEDDLGEEGDEIEAQVVILHRKVEHIEIHTEVVSDIFPRDMVKIGVLQELLPIHVVEAEGEESQGEDSAGHQPQSRGVDLQH